MRHFILAITLLMGLTLTAQTEYRFNSKPNGFSVSSKSTSAINIDYNVSAITLEDSYREGLEGQFLTLSGIFIPNQAGAPNLPSSSAYVAIPNGAKASIQLVSSKTKTIENVDLIPAPVPQLDNDKSAPVYEKDMAIYNRNAFYPATPYSISEVMTIRGVNMVQVGVMPFQYNPVTKELVVYEDLDLQVSYEGGDGTFGDIRYRTPGWDQILQDMLLNRDALPKVDYGEKLRKHYANRETGCELMIIVPDNNDFIALADSIKQFRTAQGIPTEIFTVTQCGGNNNNSIRNFIRNAYNSWDMPPEAILIIGDHNADGTMGVVSHTMNNHPGDNNNPYISDNKYADVNNDHLPDIIIGRITGRNYNEMHHMVKKDFDYERTPPTNPDFYDKPVTAMGFQLERWFQLCSEVVNGFWQYGLGKHPVRINAVYQGTPGSRWSTNENTNTVLNYFGPNGCGYVPQTMSHLTDWDGNGEMINECINNGAFIVQHRDHGSEEVWGEPSYNISYIKRLHNSDLSYIMSNNCLTGRFDYGGVNGECFAEVFHRHEQGALGLVAATQVSYSFVNDVYVWGAYDNMWPEFMPSYGTVHKSNFLLPAFGNVAGKYFLSQSSWTNSSVKEITYYLFHHHGDPYMNLYSEVPQQLDVEMLPVLIAGSDQYQIKVDQDATICLTANGQIIGFDEGTGSTQTITVTPQEVGTRVLLTIKKQNYYRYEHELATIATDAPYLIFNTLEINDDDGNGNQEPDYNETFKLNVSLHNVGFANIDNVQATLSCQHPKVQIIGSEANYGTINFGETAMVDNAFKLHLDESLNDGETVRLYLTMGDCSHVYHDSIDLKVNAPVLSCASVSFTDLNGEPTDRLHKGESTLMSFNIVNGGHSKSLDLTGHLAIDASFLDITDNTVTIEGIEAGETAQVTFQVNLFDYAPKGNILDYSMDAESGSRSIHQIDRVSVGYTSEDFQDQDLNPNLVWDLGSGSKKWYIVEDATATEGHCLRSPEINNSSSAKLKISIRCDMNENFSFLHKTSTEPDDVLTLSINNDQVGSWSGETDWELSTFELNEGQNLLIFTYKKDGQDVGGEDCVMIDHMLFPPRADLYVYAGDDMESCFEAPFTPNSDVLHQKDILWTSTGDGSFDDPSLEKPTYYFGTDDLTNGQVTLTLTASASANNSQQSSSFTLTALDDISTLVPELPTGATAVDLRLVSQSTYQAGLGQDYEFHWTLSPETAGDIQSDGNQATVVWANGFKGNAVVSYRVDNGCYESAASTPLNITVTNTTSVDETSLSAILVYPNPAQGTINLKADYIPSGQVVIRLIDPLGRIVFQTERSVNDNTLEEHINISTLSSGLYDLQVILENQTFNTRVVVR